MTDFKYEKIDYSFVCSNIVVKRYYKRNYDKDMLLFALYGDLMIVCRAIIILSLFDLSISSTKNVSANKLRYFQERARSFQVSNNLNDQSKA